MNLFEYPMYPRVPPRCPQVQVLVDSVVGCLPVYRDAQHLALPTVRPSALWVEAVLADRYDTLGIPVRTSYAEATFSGCTWDTTLTFATRVSWDGLTLAGMGRAWPGYLRYTCWGQHGICECSPPCRVCTLRRWAGDPRQSPTADHAHTLSPPHGLPPCPRFLHSTATWTTRPSWR